jgi:hypothetical protein
MGGISKVWGLRARGRRVDKGQGAENKDREGMRKKERKRKEEGGRRADKGQGGDRERRQGPETVEGQERG